MLSCNIVRELLPNYIDALTSEETNGEISGHIENCAGCRAVYESMKAPIPIDAAKEEKNINFLKKTKRIMRRKMLIILGSVIGVILIAAAVFIRLFIVGAPVSYSEVAYQTRIEAEDPKGVSYVVDKSGINWEDVSHIWLIDIYLNDDRRDIIFITEHTAEIDEDSGYIHVTTIITPRQRLPLLPHNFPPEFAEGNRLSFQALFWKEHVPNRIDENTFIFRFSDRDIVFTQDDMGK